MKKSKRVKIRIAEHGGARVKLLVAVTIISLIANAGFNFIPTAYQAESFKQEMSTILINAISLPSTYGEPKEVVRFRLGTAIKTNELPYDTFVDVKAKNNSVTARVYYKKLIPIIPFGIYDYEYVFDHTATPSGFLTK